MSTSRRLVVLSRRRRRSQAHRSLGHHWDHWDHWGTMEQKSQGRKSHTPPKGRYRKQVLCLQQAYDEVPSPHPFQGLHPGFSQVPPPTGLDHRSAAPGRRPPPNRGA